MLSVKCDKGVWDMGCTRTVWSGSVESRVWSEVWSGECIESTCRVWSRKFRV